VATNLFWPSEMRRLPGYRIYAIDLPGHGKSGGRGRQSIEAYVDALREWLVATGLHSAVIVGHSMGSAIALLLALNFPEHVVGLGLFGAAPRLRVASDLLENASNATTLQNAINLVTSRSYSTGTAPAFSQLAGRRMAETRPSVLYGDFMACDAFDVSDRLDQVSVPTLVVCGQDDQMTPPRLAQLLAAGIPRATLEIIPNAGHMVQLEQPVASAAALSGFLSTVNFY